jgi:hypothetical protein
MNEISINKEAYKLLNSLFYNKLVPLEHSMLLSKQLVIKKIQDKIEIFIERNPYGQFEIRVLNNNTVDIEDYKYALVIKNYRHEDKGRKSNLFIITIDAPFDSVTFYQMSLNGLRIEI